MISVRKVLVGDESGTFTARNSVHRLVLRGSFGGGTFNLREKIPGESTYFDLPDCEWTSDVGVEVILNEGHDYEWEFSGGDGVDLNFVLADTYTGRIVG